jgi:type I restriction-modification system DNA methylase subunit
MSTDSIISKVWGFCTTLRDDGVGYGDYLEQLTYLIFLKMADEYSRPPHNRKIGVPAEYSWPTTRRAWTPSGSKTKASLTSTTSPTRKTSARRSWRTSRRA